MKVAKKYLYSLFTLILFTITLVSVILYSRGYRISIKEKALLQSGIFAISSYPKATKVYINGTLKGVTDLNLTLPAGEYTLTFKKEGYREVSKTYKLLPELVISTDTFLVPQNPSLTPLTTVGVSRIFDLRNDTDLILFSEKSPTSSAMMYRYNFSNFPFGVGKDIQPLFNENNELNALDINTINIQESPNGDQLLLTQKQKTYLIDTTTINKNLIVVDKTKRNIEAVWQKISEENTRKILETYPKEFEKVASRSAINLIFSPDKTKLLYLAKNDDAIPLTITPSLPQTTQLPETRTIKSGNWYVFDKKEDKNYALNLPKTAINTRWYTDSRRIVFIDSANKTITSKLYDGSEEQIIYSGPFLNNFFTVSPDGNLIVLLNLNPANNSLPDLYKVGIR